MSEEERKPLRAVSVAETNNGGEYHEVGHNRVTAITWSERPGEMAMVPTIVVWRDGKMFSEHPFSSVLGVYFAEGQSDAF